MSARGWFLFAAVSVIWGLPYLFIKLAVEELSPGFVAWSRLVVGGVVLLPLAWRLGALRGLRARFWPLLAFAIVEAALPFTLISFGEKHISSSLAAILVATVPLMIALLALRFDRAERARGLRLVGLFLGLGGVVLLLGVDVAGQLSELVGAVAVLLATIGYAAGPLIAKHYLSDLNPLGAAAGALTLAAVILTPVAAASAPTSTPSLTALLSLAVLGLVCTALAFVLFFALVAEIGPSRASVITYVNPAVAVVLGVAVLQEPITAAAVAGLLLILAGSWLSTGGRAPPGIIVAVEWIRNRKRLLPDPSREQCAHPLLAYAQSTWG